MSKKKNNNKYRLCFDCDECIYIGEGDSICGITNEMVIEDFGIIVRKQCPKDKHKENKE